MRTAVGAGGKTAVGALTVVGMAAAVTVGWDAVVLPTVTPSVHVVGHDLGPALTQSFRSLPQLFGVFGWLDTKPPGFVSDVALAVYALVLLAGVMFGTRRQRLVLVGAVATTAVGSVLVDAVTQLPFGFGLQARYVMPLSAVTLLLSAWVVHERVGPGRLLTSVVPRVLGVVLVGGLGLAWLANARQAAGGAGGPRLFFRHPQWAPPGGWPPWIIVAALGGLVLLVAVLLPRTAPGGAAAEWPASWKSDILEPCPSCLPGVSMFTTDSSSSRRRTNCPRT